MNVTTSVSFKGLDKHTVPDNVIQFQLDLIQRLEIFREELLNQLNMKDGKNTFHFVATDLDGNPVTLGVDGGTVTQP